MITSSTSPGSIFARSIACLTAWPAIAAPCVLLKPPRYDFAKPVRAVETITASRIEDLPESQKHVADENTLALSRRAWREETFSRNVQPGARVSATKRS